MNNFYANECHKNKILIWGAGKYGKLAYFFYKDEYDILGYIDGDEYKRGKVLNNIPIYTPEILEKMDAYVVIAVKNGIDEIRKQLENKYKIYSYAIFNIKEEFLSAEIKKKKTQENSIIVSFSGGLGNQLFQYVLYKYYEAKGKNIYADLSAYNNPQMMRFQLTTIFEGIIVEEVDEITKYEMVEQINERLDISKKFVIYVEPSIYEVKQKTADVSLLNITGGILKGLFQTSVYCKQIEDKLRQILVFQEDKEYKLIQIAKQIKERNMVSVHIRRGDYLKGNNSWIYGNICTENYYEKAIKYMREHSEKCEFCFFSDDIEWVKKIMKLEGAMYISDDMFDEYEDWYDMYLMSICRHNIIANSTFSWWGAWLNQNKDKIVVAPKKWVNQCEYLDIYPDEWIRM